MNMAIDEALLEQATAARPALLRLAPAVALLRLLRKIRRRRRGRRERRELVRRWTGGGIVRHGEDLTYSLVTPATDPASAHGPTVIYAALHGAIRDALQAEGSEAELAAQAAPKISDACFANPVRDDVMLQRPQDRRGRAAPDTRRFSPSGQHPTSRAFRVLSRAICRCPGGPDSSKAVEFRRELLDRAAESGRRKIRHRRMVAPPVRRHRGSFDIKSRPSILRL